MATKYDKIGIDYNLTRKADPYLVSRFLYLLNSNKSETNLDIGSGTGNYTNEFGKKGLNFIGIDPSEKMLSIARERNQHIDWICGKAENIDLRDSSIDRITASLTIHHWADLNQGFQELSRILKNEGRIVIFTSLPKQMKGYWLNEYFPIMMADSITQMPSLNSIKKACSYSNLYIKSSESYSIQPDLKDLFLYSGKQNPSLYLNEKVRSGISSFSSLANQNEVEKGLEKLKNDVDNHKINDIIKSYQNELGDYLFLVIEKQ